MAAWVRERFGGRVRDVRLFGSYARGEAHEDSDVDVLVVVDGLTNAEAREIGYHTGDLLTEYDVIVSALALSREHYDELVSRERAIVQEIQRDGVPL